MTTATEFSLSLKLPHTQYVVPAHARTMRPVAFTDQTPVMVRVIACREADVAYRVSAATGALDPFACPDFEILRFEDRYWWPAIWDGRKVVETDLVDSAAGASTFAAVSIVPSTPLSSPEFPKVAPPKIRRYGESDWGDWQARANHGVCDVAFFGDFLHLAAGVPVFHAIETGGGLDMQIGTSEWNRLRPVQVLPGPRPSRSIASAHAGRIFGLDEMDGQRRLLCDRGYGVYRSVEIERAGQPDCSDSAAARLSARGVIDRAWEPASSCLAPEARHAAIPSLFDPRGTRRSIEGLADDMVLYRALKEIAAMHTQTISPALRACIVPAQDVLPRLADVIDGDALSGYM